MRSTAANWFHRKWRLLRPGRNPLARRLDRIEAVVFAITILSCLVAIPTAASIGSNVYASQRAVAERQHAERHRTTAITLADAPPAVVTEGQVADSGSAEVAVRWSLPDGTVRTDTMAVTPQTPRGAAVPVWLDRDGGLTTEPIPFSAVTTAALGAAIGAWAGFLLAALLAMAIVRAVLDRKRSAEWKRDWERYGGKLSRP